MEMEAMAAVTPEDELHQCARLGGARCVQFPLSQVTIEEMEKRHGLETFQ